MSFTVQISSLPAHVGAIAVRAFPEGACERSVCQIHRRAADPALAALLTQAHTPSAGSRRTATAAAAAAGGSTRQRRLQVKPPHTGDKAD